MYEFFYYISRYTYTLSEFTNLNKPTPLKTHIYQNYTIFYYRQINWIFLVLEKYAVALCLWSILVKSYIWFGKGWIWSENSRIFFSVRIIYKIDNWIEWLKLCQQWSENLFKRSDYIFFPFVFMSFRLVILLYLINFHQKKCRWLDITEYSDIGIGVYICKHVEKKFSSSWLIVRAAPKRS